MTGGAIDSLPDGVARLAKPFQLDELLAAVQALHHRLPGLRPLGSRRPWRQDARPAQRPVSPGLGSSSVSPADFAPMSAVA